MKTLILPVLLLAIVLVFSVISGNICRKSIDEIVSEVKKLPEKPENDTGERILEIMKKWDDKRELYSVVSKYDYISNVTKEMQTLLAGCDSNDIGTYLTAKHTLVDSLEYIRDIQSVRADNIL